MNDQSKTKEELILELQKLRNEYKSLKEATELTEVKNRDRELLLKGKIVDNMSEGVFLIRTDDGVIIYANPSINRMFKAAPNELIGKQISTVNAPTIRSPEEIASEITDHLKTKGSWKGEIQNIRMDGTTFWSFAFVSTFNDPKFGIVWIAIHQGINELKLANKAFTKIERRFRTMFEDAPLGIALIDSITGRIYEVNPMFAKIAGRSIEEMAKIDWISITHPDDIQEDLDNMALLIKGKFNGFQMEKRYIRPDGSWVWIHMTISHLIEEENMPLRHLCMIEDITERKLLENKLNEKIILLEDSQELALLGSYRIDIPSQTIFLSPEMAELYGADRKAICLPLEEYRKQFYFPDDFEKSSKLADNAYLSGTPFYLESRVIRTDGKVIWIQTRSKNLSNGTTILGVVQDITERKLAEEALKTSENEFKLLAESMPQIVWVTRSDGWNIYFNQQWVEYTGLSLEESYGHGWNKPFHPDDQQRAWDAWQNAIKNKGSYSIECQLRRKDGIYRWWLIRGVPVLNLNGSISKWFGTCTDIHEIKQTEKELIKAKEKAEESEMYFRSVFENSPIGLSITSLDGSIKTNKAFSDLLGYSYEEVQTKTWMQITHPDDISESSLAIDSLLKGQKKSIQIEKRYLHKNGSIIYVILTSTLQKTDSGKPLFINTSILDITRQKQTEIKLKESEEKYRYIYDNAIEGMFRTSMDGKSLMANPAVALMLGYNSPAEYLKEMNDSANQVWYIPEQRSEYIFLLEKHNILKGYECQLKRKDGSPIWVSLNAKIVRDENGNEIYTEGFIEEITERKKTEIELIAAKEKAEESDRLKSAFLANMSHEIRTPMNGILGFADLLKDSKLSGEEILEYISLIEKSGARMLNIINDIVDISKIESGQMNVNITESNINEQLDYICTFFRPEVEQKGMNLLVKNSLPSKESVVQTDREKVFAILTNLIKNAIKFSDKGTIEFGYILKQTGEPAELEFFVKDQGIGIPSNRQQAIFERFIQADIGDKRAYQGAGLGLAITKSYVEMLGGKIWLESEEGIGSVFYFTLPYLSTIEQKVTSGDNGSSIETLNLNKKLKILIAEDDEISENLISILIKKISDEVIKVKTGEEAVETCHNNSDIDLILMDIQMPIMDGYEATRQIRKFNKNIIIIAQTAFGLSGDREKAIEAGCNDYISKPINANTLTGLILSYF